MKSIAYLFTAAAACLSLHSCQLLEPDDIVNPNVDENTFIHSANAMQAWTNGANSSFATSIGMYCQLMEILSDNYFNNYSQSSKVFDIPRILYTDQDVTNLQRYVGTMRETANYGINTVAKADTATTKAELFNLYYIKAYSEILAGEYFLALPETEGGDVVPWEDHLKSSETVLDDALQYTTDDESKAFIRTLKARAYYRLGDKDNAVKEAKAALALSDHFVKQVKFDYANGVMNDIQEAVYDNTWFQPLPRLDFLDPKYYPETSSTEQRPITIAKAEEDYLILAEASLADSDIPTAKNYMKQLLTLVKARPVLTDVKDWTEGRYNGGYKHFPNSSDYQVAASEGEPFRSGLVLDRSEPHVLTIPYISGTSVTESMIDNASGVDGTLELLYLMRQEIFFGEGRRPADLGIRLPVCEIEAAHAPSASKYEQAQIPSFIPLNQGMDEFTMDEKTKKVVIKYNMNKIIVANKQSAYVCPFFK